MLAAPVEGGQVEPPSLFFPQLSTLNSQLSTLERCRLCSVVAAEPSGEAAAAEDTPETLIWGFGHTDSGCECSHRPFDPSAASNTAAARSKRGRCSAQTLHGSLVKKRSQPPRPKPSKTTGR